MTRMHNPPHPGEVLREYLGSVSVAKAAANLGVHRATLSRVLTCSAGISADMAYRLVDAFDTSPELWGGMQLQYNLYQAGKVKQLKRTYTSSETPFLITNQQVFSDMRCRSHREAACGRRAC